MHAPAFHGGKVPARVRHSNQIARVYTATKANTPIRSTAIAPRKRDNMAMQAPSVSRA